MSRDYRVRPLPDDAADDPSAGEADAPDAPGADEPEVREASVPAAMHGERFDKMLVSIVPEFSRNYLQSLIDAGHARVDGAVQTSASRKVQGGQHVRIELVPTAESRAFRAEAIPIAVVHEDADVLVVDKPAGLVVHPAAGHWSGTLLNALLAHHGGAAALPRAGIVHRLDKDTSGLMVVGKSLVAVTALVRAIAAREVHREYRAIAHGRVVPERFSIDAPIGRDPQSRVRMAVTGGGKAARTDVECLAAGERHSALRCTLHSGRTHQIRAHLASRGHPLVADAVYGGKPALGLERQALHAARLAFRHPVSGEALAFESALPVDLAAAWRELGASV